jgi:U6 snRNA-associated Sm-like protein LSm1
LVLQDTIERIHVGNCYGDIPRGIFLIRGENVVLLGEIVSVLLFVTIHTLQRLKTFVLQDLEREGYSALQQVPVEEILVAQREEQEMKQKREKMKNKVLNDRGFSVDYMENDLY